MHIHLAADMEGVTGVTSWDHVTSSHAEYARFRRLMTADVNAAARGALAAGASTVTVSDGHGGGSNLLIEELHPEARLHTGSPSPLSMVQGLSAAVAGVILVGYHARAGTPQAILDHTWAGAVHAVRLNGVELGEIGLNASVCGHFDVPVIAVSGCAAACAEAAAVLPGVATAAVKRAVSRTAADCLTPVAAQQTIEAAARQAVSALAGGQAPAPRVVTCPVQLEVEFTHSNYADAAAVMPGAVRAGRTLSYQAGDMLEAYRAFRALVRLA